MINQELECINESRNSNGDCLMDFTKGHFYESEYCNDNKVYYVIDNKGNTEVFFNINIMFKKI